MNTLTRVRSIRRAYLEASVDLTKRRMWYADEEATTDATTTEAAPEKPVKDDKKTYTQAELDVMFQERAASAKNAAISALLKDVGVDSPDVLKKLLADKKTADEAAMSKEQLLEQKLSEAQKEAEDAKAARAAMEQERALDRRNDEIKSALTTARCSNPVKVMALISVMQADELKATLKADGSVDKAAVNKLIDAAKKEHKEYFVGITPGSPSNNNARTSGQSDRVELKRKVQA